MWAIMHVLARELGGIYTGQLRNASGVIVTAVSMVLSWKSSLVWKRACLIYGVYIPVGKWHAMVMQDHMRHVLQHSHGRTTHAYKGANPLCDLRNSCNTCELTQRCGNVRETQCNNLNRQVLPLKLNMFITQSQPDVTILSHKTNVMHHATEATGYTNC